MNNCKVNPIDTLILVYRGEDGTLHTQAAEDLVESGTLIDPDTGDDMDLIGWRVQP